MKLYRVYCELSYEVLCLADSPEAAKQAVEDEYAQCELDIRSFDDLLFAGTPKEISSLDQVGKEWHGSLVYHPGQEDITTEEAIESVKAGQPSIREEG